MDAVSQRAALPDAESAAVGRAEAGAARALKQDQRSSRQRGLFACGRVFLGLVFVGAGVEQLADYSGMVASMMETVVDVRRLLPLAIGLQLTAGAMIVLGFQARWGASALGLYLLVETLLVPPDLGFDFGRAVAMANLGLMSALLMVAAHGAGPLSLDHVFARRRRSRRSKASARKAGKA